LIFKILFYFFEFFIKNCSYIFYGLKIIIIINKILIYLENKMTDYLTEQNAYYIMNIMKRFMKDKYNFDIETIDSKLYFKNTTEIMNDVYNDYGDTYDKTNLNKVALSELKEFIIKNYINQRKDNINEIENIEGDIEQDKDQKSLDDDEFINRLQDLELKRNMNISMSKTNNKDNINNIQSFEQVYQTDSNSNYTRTGINNNDNNKVQNVFIPIPQKIGKELQIHSWQRNWVLEEPNINGFKWKESLPKQINRTNLKIGCLIAPKKFLLNNGLITIRIEGVNEEEEYVSMIPEKIVGEYVIYRPVLDTLSYIRLLSTPWTITIETSDGEMINLGNDSINYTINNIIRNTTILSVENAANLYNIGNSLRVYLQDNNKIISASIIDVTDNTITIDKVIKSSGKLLNFSNQFSIIIETSINEHFRK
jgi:hypothetical protein